LSSTVKIAPKGDRILVRESAIDEAMSTGGIAMINVNPKDDQLMRAEVIAVGDGVGSSGSTLNPPAGVGEFVLVPRYQGWEVQPFYTGDTVLTKMYSFGEVLAVCE
jgi:co-chaperonin GroES (HSP10)